MPGFLYYLPNRSKVSPAELKELGLAYAFVNLGHKHLRIVREGGPDGGSGLIVACQQRVDSADAGYYPEKQTWKQHAGSNVWVGLVKDKLPGPDDLAHARQLPGEPVELEDGNLWNVPQARRWSATDDPEQWLRAENLLPRRLDLADGHLVISGSVVARYARLWSIAEAHARVRIHGADDELFRGDSAVIAAAAVLQANYAVGLVECLLLGLFTQTNYAEVFEVLSDWRTFDLLVEKKTKERGDSSSGINGAEANSPATDRP